MAKYVLIVLSLALAAFVAPIRATENWESLELADDASSGRLLISTNNTLGTSFVPDARSILVAILVVILGYAVFSPVVATQFGSGRNDYYKGQNQYYNNQYGYEQSQFYARSDEQALGTKMLQLERIFKKFEVKEEECKAYIACEAAQEAERIAQNGPVVEQVSKLISEANDFEKHEVLKQLKQAYDEGYAKRNEFDACATWRQACESVQA